MISEGGITIGYDNPRRAKSGKSIVTRWTSYLNDRSRVTFFQFDHESIRFIYHQLTDVNLPNVRVETKGPSLVDLIALTRSIEWTNQRTAGVHARKRTKQLLLDRFARRSFPRGARSKRSNYPFRGQRLFCLNLRHYCFPPTLMPASHLSDSISPSRRSESISFFRFFHRFDSDTEIVDFFDLLGEFRRIDLEFLDFSEFICFVWYRCVAFFRRNDGFLIIEKGNRGLKNVESLLDSLNWNILLEMDNCWWFNFNTVHRNYTIQLY